MEEISSKLDASLPLIQGKKGVVSLVLNEGGIHALLVIEGVHKQKPFYRVVDFLPAGVTGNITAINWQAIIENPDDEGQVRDQQVKDVRGRTAKSLLKEFKISSRRETLNWPVTQDKLTKLDENIATDKANPPRFELAGSHRKGAQGFNCVTWAEKILDSIGIKINLSYKTRSTDKLIAVPEYHVAGAGYCYGSYSTSSCVLF